MSRGLGPLQRFVLDTLDARWTTAEDLTQRRAGRANVTRSERESVRRAIHALHARGLVETNVGGEGAFGHRDGRLALEVRLARRKRKLASDC